ncbi:MAG: hypothetical protein Q9213_002189 [Squamulea squamosa]
MTSPSLETLTPEIQAQILRNIDSVPAFFSLLRASPRLYQVFRDRKEYLLTQLAFNQFHPEIVEDVWTMAKALQIPQPATKSHIHDIISDFMLVDEDHQQHSIPTSTTAPLCKIGMTIAWFVEDYRRSSLQLLADLGTHMDIQQDTSVLQSDLSVTEKGRIQRALCRFVTFCCLFATPEGDGDERAHYRQNRRYLLLYTPDDVEEIACIRDYLFRRL